MEYRPIADLDNLYPLTENSDLTPYTTVSKDLVNLFGLYPETNKVNFPIKSINDIQIVDKTNFQFIIAVKKYNIDGPDATQYFTSPNFYSLLETSLYESNPYFVNAAQGKFLYYNLPLSSNKTLVIDAKYIVEFVLEETLKLFSTPANPNKKSIRKLENEAGVNFTKNIYYNYLDNSVDYYSLIKYIDWVVSSENLTEIIEQNGVLEAKDLCEFQYGRLDADGNFISVGAYDLITKLQDLQDELDAINTDIGKVEYAIKNPTNAELNLSNVALGLIGGVAGAATIGLGAAVLFGGYSLAAAGIGGALSYAAAGAVLGPIGLAAGLVLGGVLALFGSNNNKNAQQKAINEFVANLKGELAKLKARKAELELQISNLKQNISVLGSTKLNPSGVNKFDFSTNTTTNQSSPPPPTSGTIDAPYTGGNQGGGAPGGQGFNYTGTFGS
jgi:prefoldin subunit 5